MEAHLTILLLIATVFLLIYKYITQNYGYWKKKGFSYIQPKFPFGNFANVAMIRTSIGEFMGEMYFKSHEKMVGFWIFGRPHLLVRSPEIVKQILVSDFQNFSDRAVASNEKADPVSAFLLLTMKNPDWKSTRSKMTPIFTTTKLKGMTPLVEKSAVDMQIFLSKNEGIIEIKEICAKYTTDVITSCAFGIEAGCFENDNSPFRVAGRTMLDATVKNGARFISYFLIPQFVNLFKIPFFDPKSTDFLKTAFWQTINHRKDTEQKRNDLIDVLIELQKKDDIGNGVKFADDRIVAQAIQFFAAGFETTSTTMSFVLYQLGKNCDVQMKAREEINSVYKTFGGFTYESLPNMKYLDKVISETLRMFPPLPFLDRKCMHDFKVPGTNLTIEKDTPVFISMLGLHYDPQFWKEPTRFDPERFTEECISQRPHFAYMPFGHGQHNCIGERFADIAMKMGLAHILRNYQIDECEETVQNLKYNPYSFVLQADSGLFLKCKKIVR